MSGKTELFVFLTAALMTMGGWFTAQMFFTSQRDVSQWDALNAAPMTDALSAARNADKAAFDGAKVPLAEAKKMLAERGRGGFPEIGAHASDDYSALSGWVHAKGFKPFVPPAPPPPPVVEPTVPAEGAAAPVEAAPAGH